MIRIKLERVRTMPAQLESGVLYVSEEFETAAHLCACGCGSKVRTPLGPTEWRFTDHPEGPSLYPSIGNWHRSCKSHYWIDRGEIEWSTQLTPAQNCRRPRSRGTPARTLLRRALSRPVVGTRLALAQVDAGPLANSARISLRGEVSPR
jgi:hypothetical protein